MKPTTKTPGAMPRKRAALITLLILVGLLALPVALTYREVRHERLNHVLIAAVIGNNVNQVRSLLQQGASPNAFLADASYDNRSTWIRLLDTALHRSVPLYNGGGYALTLAIDFGSDNGSHYWVVDALLDAGANPNVKGAGRVTTPLRGAIRFHQQKTLQALFRHHVDVNLRDDTGSIPLMLAALRTDTEMVQTLLHRGAAINMKDDDGQTALCYAVNGGVLVSAADVNVSIESIRTTVACLLRNGASVQGRDKAGMTILEREQGWYHDPQLIQMLKQAGAK